jgi:hypothetical protein
MTTGPDRPISGEVIDPAGPVFVLTSARSGSTLMRYLLDAHPELACPAETGLPSLGLQLASSLMIMNGAPKPSLQATSLAGIPEPVVSRVRATLDSMMGQYLADRNKRRFCEKSLGTAKFADLLIRLYPDVRFIGLVRHVMDFIASAAEANPWGPLGYGFDEYVTGGSGNMVRNLARYWTDHTGAIASVALMHPDHVFLVRYEDLVEAPELLAAKIFGFLGVSQQPGITQRCLRAKSERLSQGDHKIWWTSRISTQSVGRGQAVPPFLLTQPVADEVNALLRQFSYLPVDSSWGTPEMPADPRKPGSGPTPSGQPPYPELAMVAQLTAHSLEERLRTGLRRVDANFTARWQGCSSDTFACVARSRGLPDQDAHWLIDLLTGTMSAARGGDYQWCIVGEHGAWDAVLGGQTDLGTAFRRSELRYCEGTPVGPPADSNYSAEVPVTEDRVDMVGDLLGLTPWLAARSAPYTSQPG